LLNIVEIASKAGVIAIIGQSFKNSNTHIGDQNIKRRIDQSIISELHGIMSQIKFIALKIHLITSKDIFQIHFKASNTLVIQFLKSCHASVINEISFG